MEITDIKIRKTTNDGKMKAIVSVTFDDELAVHDIKIIQGRERLFLAMPSRRMALGGYSDIAHPTSAELRSKIESAVLDKYADTVNQQALY